MRSDEPDSEYRDNVPRLQVDINGRSIKLDGEVFRGITSRLALRWVKVLSERPGLWVASRELERFDCELLNVKTSELRQYLPGKIERIIESKTHRGSRLVLPPLRPHD